MNYPKVYLMINLVILILILVYIYYLYCQRTAAEVIYTLYDYYSMYQPYLGAQLTKKTYTSNSFTISIFFYKKQTFSFISYWCSILRKFATKYIF